MKKALVVLALLIGGASNSGCATGIGRAMEHAFSGPPESVAKALDLSEEEYLRCSNIILKAATEDTPTTDAGKMYQAAYIRNSQQAQRDYLDALSHLRSYYGVESSGAATAAREAAVGRWDDLLGIAMKHLEGIDFGGQ